MDCIGDLCGECIGECIAYCICQFTGCLVGACYWIAKQYQQNVKTVQRKLLFWNQCLVIIIVLILLNFSLALSNVEVVEYTAIINNWKILPLTNIQIANEKCPQSTEILSNNTIVAMVSECSCPQYKNISSENCTAAQLQQNCSNKLQQKSIKLMHWSQPIGDQQYKSILLCGQRQSMSKYDLLKLSIFTLQDCKQQNLQICHSHSSELFYCVQIGYQCPITQLSISTLKQQKLHMQSDTIYENEFYASVIRDTFQSPLISTTIAQQPINCSQSNTKCQPITKTTASNYYSSNNITQILKQASSNSSIDIYNDYTMIGLKQYTFTIDCTRALWHLISGQLSVQSNHDVELILVLSSILVFLIICFTFWCNELSRCFYLECGNSPFIYQTIRYILEVIMMLNILNSIQQSQSLIQSQQQLVQICKNEEFSLTEELDNNSNELSHYCNQLIFIIIILASLEIISLVCYGFKVPKHNYQHRDVEMQSY